MKTVSVFSSVYHLFTSLKQLLYGSRNSYCSLLNVANISVHAGLRLRFWEVLLHLSIKSECLCMLSLWEVLPRKRSQVSCAHSQSWSREPCIYQSSNWESLLPSWWIWNKWSIIRWYSTCSEPKVFLLTHRIHCVYLFFADNISML